MTEQNKPTRQYKKRAPKASTQAEAAFPDYIDADERPNQLESDVNDIFAHIAETADLRSHSTAKYAKRDEPSINSPEPSESVTDSNTVFDTTTVLDMNEGSPKVTKDTLENMVRAEEVAADLARTKGVFIDGVDNAKIGVPFKAVESDIPIHEMPLRYGDQMNIRADGVEFNHMGVLDTGHGAQGEDTMPTPADRDNPASPHYMVCVNKNCRYREHCMRYRMNNKRNMKTVFFPEDCRRDGIFQSVDNSDYEAYDPMNILESTSTPSF